LFQPLISVQCAHREEKNLLISLVLWRTYALGCGFGDDAGAVLLYIQAEFGLCSSQRGFHAHARKKRTACTGHQALVAVARPQHLPAAASARAAHAHST